MEIVQMKGFMLTPITAAHTMIAVRRIFQDFVQAEDYITHAEKLKNETDWIHDQEMFNAFLADLSG